MSEKSPAPEYKPWHTPWNKASYDRFINERLPELLAERLPLASYQVAPEENAVRKKTSTYWHGNVQWAPSAGYPATCRVTVTLATATGELPLVYRGIYQKTLAKKSPVHEVLLDMVIKHVPNPYDAQKIRVFRAWEKKLLSLVQTKKGPASSREAGPRG